MDRLLMVIPMDNGLLEVRSYLAGGVELLEDRDVDTADSCRWRVLFYLGRKLSAQAKVDLAQLVVSGVYGPHGCEYFSDR